MYPGNEKIKETKQSCCWSPVLALQTPPAYDVEQDICMMTPFDYKDQNPSGFAFLILIDLFTGHFDFYCFESPLWDAQGAN